MQEKILLDLDEILILSKKIYPFGDDEGFLLENGENYQFLERNLLKILRKTSFHQISPQIRTLLQYFPNDQNSDYFNEYNSNYSLFLTLSMLNTMKLFHKNQKDLDNFSQYFNYLKKWFESLNNNSTNNSNELKENTNKFLFFRFDLLKDIHLDFLIKSLLNTKNISLLLFPKELQILQVFLKNLFLDLITYNFFESSEEITKKLRFFSLQTQGFSFKKSYFYKGLIIELKSFIRNLNDFTEKTNKFTKIRAILCVQEFFEAFSEETQMKIGFDERFFAADYKEIHLNEQYMINCMFFQRKIPENLRNLLFLENILIIDCLGEKNINNLSIFLNISPINSLYCLKEFKALEKEKIVKEINGISLLETEVNQCFLMIPEECNSSLNSFYNLLFYLPRERLLKTSLFEEIPLVLGVIFDALCEEEFLLEKNGFELRILAFITIKTRDLINGIDDKKQIKGYLQGFYCIVKGFQEILQGFSVGKCEGYGVLERIFENCENYLKDYSLFLSDCALLEITEEFFVKGEMIFENLVNIKEEIYLKSLKEKKKNEINLGSLQINLKKKKFEWLRMVMNVMQEFPYLNFV